MASRITSGARLCVRAGIDRLVCNPTRSRHHHNGGVALSAAPSANGPPVGPRSDGTLPSYQVRACVIGVHYPSSLALRLVDVLLPPVHPAQGPFNDDVRRQGPPTSLPSRPATGRLAKFQRQRGGLGHSTVLPVIIIGRPRLIIRVWRFVTF